MKLLLTKLEMRESVPVVRFGMVINQKMTWNFFVYGVELCHHEIPEIEVPSLMNNTSDINHFLQHLTNLTVCQGNPDEKFHQLLPLRQGIFMNKESKLHSKGHAYTMHNAWCN